MFFNNPEGNITEYIQTKMNEVMASVSADDHEDGGKRDGEPDEAGEGESSTSGGGEAPSPRPGGSRS